MLDLLYPPACHLCSIPLEDGNYICENCEQTLIPLEPPFCKICSEPFEGNITSDFECPNCHKLTFDFDFARSALKNSENAYQLILDLKYKRKLHLAPTLAKYCADLINSTPEIKELPAPVLVPVPMHWMRKLKRSFNHADKIGRSVSELTKIPMCHGLKRKRLTTAQTQLSRAKRLQNLNSAFSYTQIPIKYRSAIIIDDVLTTGSTAQACAATLRKEAQHIENIVVVTVMRG